jgi:hypothetical protein
MPQRSLLQRIRAEFLEMPGMRLTPEQVQRLCGVERIPCQWVLDQLVEEQFLCRKADGRYARMADGHPPQQAPADLRLLPRLVRAS